METIDEMMNLIIDEINSDSQSAIARFLQANPYSDFPFYTYNKVITPKLFEETFYCESEVAKKNKEELCDALSRSHGKNTFFVVGYQGCGKTTFIHSVINMYSRSCDVELLEVICDEYGVATNINKLRKIFSKRLEEEISSDLQLSLFLDFFTDNLEVIKQFVNQRNLRLFYLFIREFNSRGDINNLDFKLDFELALNEYINEKLELEDIFYLMIFFRLSRKYNSQETLNEKLVIIIDNLDYADAYSDMVQFIQMVDSLTIEFSHHFSQLKLFRGTSDSLEYTDKIKIFVAMRETTKANLPIAHFSDAFRSIYQSSDITEWYDKNNIVKKRITVLKDYNKTNGRLCERVKRPLEILLKITEDAYTQKVFYPLFNNNYRSAIMLISKIVTEHYDMLDIYNPIMDISERKFRHGARGVLFKLIFDEFNKNDGSDESCFKKIGVLDLMNRKNNTVSICRLLLSYLSNYTETKCDSAQNSVTLSGVIKEFEHIFEREEILRCLCDMFELRNTHWTHLVSFNQIEYMTREELGERLGQISFERLDLNKTMVHYNCAGKIYVEYVTTHFEFFTARIFKDGYPALLSPENLLKDCGGEKYRFEVIISSVYEEVEKCCKALREFNKRVCSEKRYGNPYHNSEAYRKSHYVCQFKRNDYDTEEKRRFKQFHEDRMINSHIVYIDNYRLYLMNYYNEIDNDEKCLINQRLISLLKKYCGLLREGEVLLLENTKEKLLPHYERQIKMAEESIEDFSIEISYNG